MAIAKFHVNKKGETGLCRAEHSCPFGSEAEHYDSPEKARVAYEDRMTAQIVPAGVSKDDLGRRDLAKLARITSDKSVMDNAIKVGSAQTLSALADNPNIGHDRLVKAADRATEEGKPKTRAKLVGHERFPVASMTPEDAVGKYNPNDFYANGRFLGSDDITDDHVNAIREKYPDDNLSQVVANPDNKISAELREKLVEVGSVPEEVYGYGRNFDPSRIKDIPVKDMRPVGIFRMRNPAYLDGYADWAVRVNRGDGNAKYHAQSIASTVAYNKNTPDSTLDKLASSGLALREVYENPNASSGTREKAASQDDFLQRRNRLKKIEEAQGGKLVETLTDPSGKNEREQPYGPNVGYTITTRTFDTAKMEELGVGEEDIHVLMDSKRTYMGASFDSATGVFVGTVDTRD